MLVWLALAGLPAGAEPPAPEPSEGVGAYEPKILGAARLCEASAAIVAPWDEDLVLVADNEVRDELYVFELKDGSLTLDEVLQIPADNRPRDIEALTRLGDKLVVVGSHSRGKHCEEKQKRHRLRLLAARSDGTLEERGFIDSEDSWKKALRTGREECLSTLFTSPAPPEAGAVCEALIAAEGEATSEACKVLNIEGAVGAGEERLWLGLRAPLVGDRAILLRLVPGFKDPRVDRVALLDLEGRGIRELTLAGEVLYGLAGPAEDKEVPFLLFRAEASEAFEGGKTSVEILRRDLMPSSEGLLVKDGRAYVLVDGDEPEEGSVECVASAMWYAVDSL